MNESRQSSCRLTVEESLTTRKKLKRFEKTSESSFIPFNAKKQNYPVVAMFPQRRKKHGANNLLYTLVDCVALL